MKALKKYLLCMAFFYGSAMAGGTEVINWISNTDGQWFDDNNWVENITPADGNTVAFGVIDPNNSIDDIDIDNMGNGINQPNDLVRLERKVVFSDSSASGDPLLADDEIIFDVMQINGAGGSGVVFNVPVTANVVSSNRHGGIFNREITINHIVATSGHQDRWEINASATKPIELLQLDENRGPDGGNTNGSFSIRSDLLINVVEHIWGHLRLRLDAMVEVDEYIYFDYTNQAENNNINPISLQGTLVVKDFMIFDVENDTFSSLAFGSYGGIGNLDADFELPFITGDGLLIITDELFANGFE